MKPSRQDIVDLLERHAESPSPTVDPVFAQQLERRLRSIDLSPATPRRRRFGRFTLMATIAVAATAGVAAAAAAVISLRRSQEPTATTKPSVTIVVPQPVTTSLVVATVEPSSSVVVATTVPATTSTVAATIATTVPPETTAVTTIPATAVPTTEVAPTTEVRVPATLTLACTPIAGAIECSWGSGPDGTTHYAVLRTEPGVSPGRVFTPEPGATTYVDTLVVPGTTYTYLVHALDDTEHSLAHSGPTSVPCCG